MREYPSNVKFIGRRRYHDLNCYLLYFIDERFPFLRHHQASTKILTQPHSPTIELASVDGKTIVCRKHADKMEEFLQNA
jgi:hypothetical protein